MGNLQCNGRLAWPDRRALPLRWSKPRKGNRGNRPYHRSGIARPGSPKNLALPRSTPSHDAAKRSARRRPFARLLTQIAAPPAGREDKVPVSRADSLHTTLPDLIQPVPEHIARTRRLRLPRSHRRPPRCDERITDRRSGESPKSRNYRKIPRPTPRNLAILITSPRRKNQTDQPVGRCSRGTT